MENLEKILKILKTNNVFLTGGGGVGKSYLCEQIIAYHKEHKKQVVVLGSTGISAVCVGGQTLHSFFAFGIASSQEEILRNDKKNKRKLKEIKQILAKCELIIIDEISMVSANILDMIRYRLNTSGYGGKILFVGDFFQLPPINKKTSNDLLGQKIYAFESLAWEYYEPKIISLSKPKRTKNLEFFEILNQIRVGKLEQKSIEFLQNLRQNLDVFKNEPTILYSTNQEVDAMNTKKLYELSGELFLFMAEQKIHDDSLHEKKFINWKKSLIANECLELKIGALVIFCINKKDSFYNGQKGIIVAIEKETIAVQKESGDIVAVEPHEFTFNEVRVNDDEEVKEHCLASFKQYPLKLAYAITIHKSQGMSIDNLVCNVDKIFEKSQFYVALSRATNPQNLFLYYTGTNFLAHILRCVKIDTKVLDFYENADILDIEKE